MLSFRTTNDLNRSIAAAAGDLARDVDAIVGIPRSGVLAASMLALHVQKPLGTVPEYADGVGGAADARRILLLDDTVCGGGTMRRAVAAIRGARPDAELVRAAVYRAPGTGANAVDRYAETVATPRAFEWNLWRSVYLPRTCLDVDGVLCEDPDFLDDDGPEMERHIHEAAPRFLPRRPVAALVTWRLARWREQTEKWLARHGVRYGRLVMAQFETADARRRAGGQAQWKADAYRDAGGWMFVESNQRVAKAIAARSGRQVWCTDDRMLYGGGAA